MKTPARWYALALTLGALPLWAGRHLPLVDLPQHLHLISVLHRLTDPTTLYPRLFAARNVLTPYLGYYYAVAGLSWLLPLELANRVFLTAYVVLLPLSLGFLLRSLGRPRWPSLLALPFAYGDSLAWGFINYCVSLPLALVSLGLFVRALSDLPGRRRWSGWLALALVGVPALPHPVVPVRGAGDALAAAPDAHPGREAARVAVAGAGHGPLPGAHGRLGPAPAGRPQRGGARRALEGVGADALEGEPGFFEHAGEPDAPPAVAGELAARWQRSLGGGGGTGGRGAGLGALGGAALVAPAFARDAPGALASAAAQPAGGCALLHPALRHPRLSLLPEPPVRARAGRAGRRLGAAPSRGPGGDGCWG